MQKKRIYILYVLCFVAGFLVPIIAPLSMREDEIILPADDTKYETEFLRAPSVALIDSINMNKLSCLCDNYEYDNLIYYWLLKDSTFYRADNNEPTSFHHTILSYFTDSTEYYSPDKNMLEYSRTVKDILQNKIEEK